MDILSGIIIGFYLGSIILGLIAFGINNGVLIKITAVMYIITIALGLIWLFTYWTIESFI